MKSRLLLRRFWPAAGVTLIAALSVGCGADDGHQTPSTGGGGPTGDGGGTAGNGGGGATGGAGGSGAGAPSIVELARYVDPLIGTAPSDAPNPVVGGSGGSVFPGVSAPFGMVQWSPDTPHSEPSGYSYKDTTITGFSLTHFSGAGCPNNGDLPIMPTLDPAVESAEFQHENEHASAGYYDVTLGNGIRTELTATERTGFGRFTYPSSGPEVLIFDGSRTASLPSAVAEVTRDGDGGLKGFTTGGDFCGHGNYYRLHFSIQSDRPFANATLENGKAVVSFDPAGGPTVHVKVGLSYVSVENAKLNLSTENSSWDFDAVRDQAKSTWNDRLNAIQVDGGRDEDKTKLYTALYHSLLFPSVFSDVNGEYIGFDGAVHAAPAGRVQYANYSGWDVYRSQIQLLSTLFPEEASDMLQSLVTDAEECGALPRWGYNNAETGIMVGDPGALIVASGHAFGATDFDRSSALKTMLRTGSGLPAACNGRSTMPALFPYLSFGYINDGAGEWGGGSETLEYTSRDFAVAQFAKALGDDVSYRELMNRSAYWQNELSPAGYLQERRADGSFRLPFTGPRDKTGYVEGNAEQYVWMVPYNPRTLFDGLGGNEAVVGRLDTFFSHLNAGLDDPYFYIGNEPNFATPWLYNWAGAPWRTQDVVRRIVDESFQSSPGGLPGNDDLGATSSWYVWSAIGLYPEIPGIGGFAIGSPQFETTNIRLGHRGVLSIQAIGAPQRYVQSMTLNDVPFTRSWLPFKAIQGGGRIAFVMGETPSTWGSAPGDAPPSYGSGTFPTVADAHNNRGMSTNASSASADLDGAGFSYSLEALAAAGVTRGGTVSHGNVSFTWPAADSALDNTIASGQTLNVAPVQRGSQLAFLGSATSGPSVGEGLLTYADGTTRTFTLGFSDWTLGADRQSPSYGNEIAIRATYRNTRSGSSENTATYVFSATVPLDASKELAAVRLPGFVSAGRLHVFAMTVVP